MFIANMQKYNGFLSVYRTSCDLQNSLLNPMGFLGIFYKDSLSCANGVISSGSSCCFRITAVARASALCWVQVVTVHVPALVPVLGERIESFPIWYDVSHRCACVCVFVDTLYSVEQLSAVCFFLKQFFIMNGC